MHFLIFYFAVSVETFCPLLELNEARRGSVIFETLSSFASFPCPVKAPMAESICIGSLVFDTKLALSRNRFVCEF